MTGDGELLRRYVEANCEEAFAELVRRHLDLVYSAALRQVNGDRHLAQDVAQIVFADLGRKAATLSQCPVLTGWLYTSTHFAAAKAVRTECRRRTHEQEAKAMHELQEGPEMEAADWHKVGPVLDQVMHELNDSDRDTLLMRYFENTRLSEIGRKLGVSEDAARKRVERALEKLKAELLKRGIVRISSLAGVISANAVQTAPAGLATILTELSLASAAGGTGVGVTVLKFMTTKVKLGWISGCLIAGVAVPLLLPHLARTRLQQENAAFRRQAAQMQSQNEVLSNQLASAQSEQSLSREELSELLKLRGEVGRLRQQVRQSAQMAANDQRSQESAVGSGVLDAATRSTAFQVRLVLQDHDENSETITNLTKQGDTENSAETLYVQKTPLVDSAALQSADVVTDPTTGKAQIDIVLTDQGRDLFAKVTKENLNKRLAIVMDGQSYLAPTVKSEITGGRIQLSGTFTEQQAKELTAKINDAIVRQ